MATGSRGRSDGRGQRAALLNQERKGASWPLLAPLVSGPVAAFRVSAAGIASRPLHLGVLELDWLRRQVSLCGHALGLTQSQFLLLAAFMARPLQAVP